MAVVFLQKLNEVSFSLFGSQVRKIHILWNNPEISRKNRALLSGVKSVINAWFSTTWTSTYQSHGGRGAGFCTRKGPDKHLSTVQVRGGNRDDLSLRDKSKGMDLMMLTVNLAFPWLSRQVFTSWIYFGNLFLLAGIIDTTEWNQALSTSHSSCSGLRLLLSF